MRPSAVAGSVNNRGSGRRILVVDDDKDLAEALQESLTLDGFKVAATHDHRRALEIAGAFRPDIALVDLRLVSDWISSPN